MPNLKSCKLSGCSGHKPLQIHLTLQSPHDRFSGGVFAARLNLLKPAIQILQRLKDG